jgi:hypothetical protein
MDRVSIHYILAGVHRFNFMGVISQKMLVCFGGFIGGTKMLGHVHGGAEVESIVV